jgi:ankyrin repeat protein
MIKYLVENGADINIKTNYGANSLLLLCERNYGNDNITNEIIKYLINYGIEVNVKDKYDQIPINLCLQK